MENRSKQSTDQSTGGAVCTLAKTSWGQFRSGLRTQENEKMMKISAHALGQPMQYEYKVARERDEIDRRLLIVYPAALRRTLCSAEVFFSI